MGTKIPHPLTLHVQVKQDAATQKQAADLQLFFTRKDVVAALHAAKPRLIHFARILQIPNNQPFDTKGVFAIQVVIVYDGPEIQPLLDLLWNTPSLRGLVQGLYTMAQPIPKPGLWERFMKWLRHIFKGTNEKLPVPRDYEGFCDYVQYNNLTPLQSELHIGYDLTVEQILEGFPAPPPISQA